MRNKGKAGIAAALLLCGCSAATISSPTSAIAPGAGREANGLAYSTASAGTIQPAPPPGSCRYRGSGLFVEPDPQCTPGALNPAVTDATIHETICRPRGLTASERPPERVTEPEKHAEMAAYSNSAPLSTIELDHDVPLTLGGAVNDMRNYWPEPNYPGVSPDSYDRNPKDVLEGKLHDLVCSGELSLSRAQTVIAANWVSAYYRYVP